jgi:hypothetical protein
MANTLDHRHDGVADLLGQVRPGVEDVGQVGIVFDY